MREKQQFVTDVQQNEGLIYKIARLYSNTNEDQKDLFQEIVYQLWKSYPSFNGDSKISTWMYRIALNTAITHLKKDSWKPMRIPMDKHLANRMEHADTIIEERVAALYTHIKTLNVIDRGIILLFLEDKSHKEIAEITGFSVTNIGTRIMRIKQQLKKSFKK